MVSPCAVTTALHVFWRFFYDSTPRTGIYTLSLHDALPIFVRLRREGLEGRERDRPEADDGATAELVLQALGVGLQLRSEEHTSELQSQSNLVCRLLLEKKKGTFMYGEFPRLFAVYQNVDAD